MWNVTFQLYDDVSYQYQVINGHTTSIPNTSRAGYNFIRWVANNSTWNTSSEITDHIIITAEYEKYIFNITIDANGGSNSSNTTMEYGSVLSQPETSRTNNALDGWYYVASYENHNAGEKVTFPVTITGDLSIKAEWNVTVTYNVKGNTYTTRTIISGTTAENISCNANGYTFNYWYSTNSSQQFDFETIVSQHLTLNANVTPIPYTITYVLNNGTNDSRNRTTYTIEDSFYIYPATRSGYYFEGWYGGGLSSTTKQPYITGFYGNKTFTADFRSYYTVTFNSNGGSSVSSQQVASGHCATKPSTPTYSGYAFNYWKLNNSEFDFSTAITSNITLVASWRLLYTVNYYSSGNNPWKTEYLDTYNVITDDYPSYNVPKFDKWILGITRKSKSESVESGYERKYIGKYVVVPIPSGKTVDGIIAYWRRYSPSLYYLGYNINLYAGRSNIYTVSSSILKNNSSKTFTWSLSSGSTYDSISVSWYGTSDSGSGTLLDTTSGMCIGIYANSNPDTRQNFYISVVRITASIKEYYNGRLAETCIRNYDDNKYIYMNYTGSAIYSFAFEPLISKAEFEVYGTFRVTEIEISYTAVYDYR